MKRALRTESRVKRDLLAGATPAVSGTGNDGSVELAMESNIKGDVYVRTNDTTNLLEWSTDGSNFESISEPLANKSSAEVSLSYDATDDFLNNFAIDTLSSLVIGNVSLPGVDLSFKALQIDVQAGVSISTASPTGNSGDLTFDAPLVSTASGSQLITDHLNDTDTPGDLLISAQGNLDTVVSVFNSLPILPKASNTEAIVNLTGTTIRAGNVTIDSDADSADKYDDEDPDSTGNAGVQVLEGLSDLVGSVSLFVGFAFSEADSVVTIDGGSILSDNLQITSNATTQANTLVLSPTAFVAGLAISEPNADISIKGGADIDSRGNVTVASDAISVSSVSTLLRSKKRGGSLAFNFGNIDSNAEIESGVTIDAGGSVDVSAEALKSQFVGGRASGFAGSRSTLSVAYSQAVTDVTAAIDGNVTAAGDVRIDSDLKTTLNDVSSTATTGISGVGGQILARVKNNTSSLSAIRGLGNLVKRLTGTRNDQVESGFAGSFAVGFHTNDVIARIGNGASVISTAGNVRVAADSIEFPQHLASSTVASFDQPLSEDRRDNSTSIALSVGVYDNEAHAFIGDGASVTASGDVTVQSSGQVPWEQQWWKFFRRGDDTVQQETIDGAKIAEFPFKKFLSFNAGLQEGLFTSWAEAFTEGEKRAIGFQANVLSIANSSKATIGDGARVTAGGDLAVISKVENDTLNFSGQNLPFPLAGADGGGFTDSKGIGGSILAIAYDNESIAEVKTNAIIDAGSLLVFARSDSRNVSVATQGGQADGVSINGAAATLIINDRTLARIDDGATVSTGNSLLEIPRDYDEYDTSQRGLFSGIPVFYPFEPLEEAANADLRVNVTSDTITLPYAHNLTSGDAVRYFNGGANNIGGLSSNTSYYVTVVDDFAVTLSSTPSGPAIDLTLDPADQPTGPADVIGHALLPGFSPADVDDVDPTIIDLGQEHGLVDGDAVVYLTEETAALAPLADGTVYFAEVVNSTQLRLSSSVNGAPISFDETSSTGVAHFIVPVTAETVEEVAPSRDRGTQRIRNPIDALDSNRDRRITADDDFIRGLTDEAYLTNLSLLVLADDNADLFNGAGGISKGHSTGAGFSLSVDSINRDTQALIGNLELDLIREDFSSVGSGIDSQDQVYLGYNHGLSNGD
ncbi:MAG: hypothetical protein AAGI63_14495, partial [Planctomycetota bacterium]